jgi:predicted phosphodiesterase
VLSETAADGVIRNQLPDDTLLVFLSDTHIGGAAGSDIFESAAELTRLVEDLNRHDGPVELVVAGDFLDMLRMEDAGGDGDGVAATITRPEYQGLFGALRAFAGSHGRRVVYVVGNHDAEVWWNPRIRRLSARQGSLRCSGCRIRPASRPCPSRSSTASTATSSTRPMPSPITPTRSSRTPAGPDEPSGPSQQRAR